MGFEPTTSSLGSWHSTTELLPLSRLSRSGFHLNIITPNRSMAGARLGQASADSEGTVAPPYFLPRPSTSILARSAMSSEPGLSGLQSAFGMPSTVIADAILPVFA